MRYLDLLIWSCLLLRWIRVLLRRVFKRKIWSTLVQISFYRYQDLQEEVVEAAVVAVAVEEVAEEEVVVVQEEEVAEEVVVAVQEEEEDLVLDEAQEEVSEEEEADAVEEVVSKNGSRFVACKKNACLFSKLFI